MQVTKSVLGSCVPIPQKAYIQPGNQQALSGSDTDVSTSTENLTAEEKNVLRNGIRQEPQGEETINNDVDASFMNTLIIHNSRLSGENNSLFYGQGSVCDLRLKNDSHVSDHENMEKMDFHKELYSTQSENMKSHHISPRNSMGDNVPPSPKSSQRKVMYNMQKPTCHGFLQQFSVPNFLHQSSPRLMNSKPGATYYSVTPENSVQEITDIPKQYLDQSEILKHLTKEMSCQYELPDSCRFTAAPPPPPPEYPKWHSSSEYNANISSCLRLDGMSVYGNNSVKQSDVFPVSRSHPDLTHLGKNYHMDEACTNVSHIMQRQDLRGRSDPESVSLQANQLIGLLSAENIALKNELDLFYKKVSKLQKFELEIQKVHQSHEDLVRSTEKREKLERTVRMRLEIEIRRLQEENKELKEYLESATSHLSKRPLTDIAESELRKELSKREVLVAQLLTQNKELLAEKEQQEILLQAQRATLQEQRNHIDILDNALTSAQTNVVRLEDENYKKQVYVERVAQLQKALTSLQQSSERRLQMEKKVRLQLEKEVEALRQQQKNGKQPSESQMQKDENDNDKETLKKTILEYEKKIIRLEAEVSKWEQRYIEESTMRQIAVDAASVPKDAKIAALERTSQESEKLIAQARSEKLKHMDELYAANRKCTELEGRIKDFESKLAEKDAMIKVLQQHSQSKDAVLQNAVLGRPPRHTRAASTVGLTTNTSHTTTVTGVSCFGRTSPSPTSMLHRRAGSKVELSTSGSLLSISSESSSITSPSESLPVTDSVTGSKKSLDEQLKDLDSRLSNKDSIISALRAEKERYPSHFWRV